MGENNPSNPGMNQNSSLKDLMSQRKSPFEKTAVKPEKTATKPEKNASRPGKAIPLPLTYKEGDSLMVGGHSLTIVRGIGNGTEGEIYVVKKGQKTYALKLCHPGYHTNIKVLSALKQLKGKGYIVDIEDFGDNFELMEYVRGESAALANLKGIAQAILLIATSIAMTIDKMHEANVLHKDIKPANILIKDTETWDCVLCDFGISDLLKTEYKDGIIRKSCVTNRNRTPIYAAPEIYKENNAIVNDDGSISSEMTPKTDFYSLGMTILSLWMGEEALNRIEEENALKKIRGNIAVPNDIPDPLNRITRGLLIKDPSKRWDFNSIQDFLNGKDVPVEEDEIVADLNIVYNATKHQIAHNLRDLAFFMEEDFQLAEGYLYRGRLNKWLSDYPEVQARLDDIVENRYRKDHEGGVMAAIYTLYPDMPFFLEGIDRQTGELVEIEAETLKEISDFCNRAIPFLEPLNSNKFVEWVRLRDNALADALPKTDIDTMTYMLRIQAIDPLSDINLCNDPNDPDYAMTQEGIARTLNSAYNIFWNKFEGDFDTLLDATADDITEKKYRKLTLENVVNITASICNTDVEVNFITEFMKTKGLRFNKQIRWIDYCLDIESEDNTKKAGPKDINYLEQVSWMKIIKGFGIDPVYHLEDEDADITTVKELMRFSKKTLRKEYDERGLRGWLAVQHHENPDADLSEEYAYERLLADYIDDVRQIDAEDPIVQRFDEASNEAQRILNEGKSKINWLNTRTLTQYMFTLLLGVLPCVVLTVLIVASIISHPMLDMSGFKIERFVWPIGLIAGVVLFFVLDSDGCLIPIILGLVGAAVFFIVAKFLGSLLLYFYLVIVLAVLIFFTFKTLFFKSDFAKKVRHFTKPGFEEYVLEPLYYAFSDENEFDSSLNGLIDDDSIDSWKDDLKKRRNNILVFIGITLLLCALSLLLPRAGKDAENPFVQRVEQMLGWTKLSSETEEAVEEEVIAMPEITGNLYRGSKGEAVTAMQKRLAQLGFYDNEITDKFDDATRNAVIAFQKANKLKADGIVGEKTMKKMFSAEAIGAEKPKKENANSK